MGYDDAAVTFPVSLSLAGADPNAVSKQHGNTPLIIAASRLHQSVVERLLVAGALVNTAAKVTWHSSPQQPPAGLPVAA